MSIWAVNWALHTEVPIATHKLVLIALANFADDQDEAWPHVSTLADLASTSPRTVHRALEALDAAGLVERSMGLAAGGRGGLVRSNSVYRLLLPETVTRRKSTHLGQPGVVRKPPGQDRCDAGVTTIPSDDQRPAQDRSDTGVVTIPSSGERPCQDRYDTGVTTMDRSATGDSNRSATGDITHKEEPSGLTTNPTPLPPTPSPTGLLGSAGSGDGFHVPQTIADQEGAGPTGSTPEVWELLRGCLPEEMLALDGPSVDRVVVLIRERLAAGWTPRMIHSILVGNSLPPNVRSLGGLVLHRIGQIPVGGAPKRLPAPTAAVVEEPVEPPEFWATWIVERTKARLLGDPDADNGRLWWLRRFPGPSRIPGRVDLEAHLRQELAASAAYAVAP